MKTLVAYKTKGGATKKYMDWLCKELKCESLTYNQIGRKFNFDEYQTIIVSSGTYMGLMPLNRFLKKNWKKIKDKHIVAIAVGAAPADDSWSNWSYNRISHRIRNHIKYFKILGDVPREEGKNKPTKVKKEHLSEIIKYIKTLR
jgi:menaquinone-dependent protoporphyrinogen IX oxidase